MVKRRRQAKNTRNSSWRVSIFFLLKKGVFFHMSYNNRDQIVSFKIFFFATRDGSAFYFSKQVKRKK
jgi:hypothetical protein